MNDRMVIELGWGLGMAWPEKAPLKEEQLKIKQKLC